ncbi:MAG: carbohydrate porin [Syntrophales bacterium]
MGKLRNTCLAFIVAALMVTTSLAAHADTDQPAKIVNTPAHVDTEAPTHTTSGNPGLSSVEALPEWMPKVLGMQFNEIYQYMPDFHSPYSGPNSLTTDNNKGHGSTQIYGLYLGSQVTPKFQIYLDTEMAQGHGISNASGLGAYTNGDVIRQGSADLGSGPYIARLYARYVYPLSGETEKAERAMDQLPDLEYTSRIEIKAGRLAATDDFDVNRYANNTRTQFLNWGFINNTAWDYAADTRGYSNGALIALVKPQWKLAFGYYQMPTTANGNDLDSYIFRSGGYNLELTVKPNEKGTVLRFLTFYNRGQMGNYDEAVRLGQLTGTIPDVRANEKEGRSKYGFGINLEQPLADEGETGLFARAGWSDGSNEDFVYTEADQHLSAGIQVSGIHWGRKEDRVGMAYLVDGISGKHQDYLAAGGSGFMLGDGQLNYGWEQIFEVYYRIQLGSYVQISPDFQFIQNPGYNKDRGPVEVYSMRVRLSF